VVRDFNPAHVTGFKRLYDNVRWGAVMNLRRWLAVATAMALVFCSSSPAGAQAVSSASVTGAVRDASEAIVPGATVQMRSSDTNRTWQAVTDDRGRFRLLNLPVGDYRLSVEIAGFATANVDLTLEVGQALNVPIVLKPAAVDASVQVVASAPIVETRRAQMFPQLEPAEVERVRPQRRGTRIWRWRALPRLPHQHAKQRPLRRNIRVPVPASPWRPAQPRQHLHGRRPVGERRCRGSGRAVLRRG
jgi:hypothetical protein